jgi:hypothetical protein
MIEKLINCAKKDKEILAVIVFGSFARGEKFRDIDVCLVLRDTLEPIKISRKKLEYLAEFPELDIQIFQQLPIYIRVRVLKEGKVVFCRDEDMLYDLAIKTMKEFEDFKPIYYEYLKGVLNG